MKDPVDPPSAPGPARFGGAGRRPPAWLASVLSSALLPLIGICALLDNTGNPDRIVLWLGGSIVAHDLILFPLYALLARWAAGTLLRARASSRVRIAALNQLRFAALMSGLLITAALFLGSAASFAVRARGLRRS